jgi:hypothetical protein
MLTPRVGQIIKLTPSKLGKLEAVEFKVIEIQNIKTSQ